MSYTSTYAVPASHTLDKPILQGLGSVSTTESDDGVGKAVLSDAGGRFVYVYMESSAVAAVAGAPAVWVDTTTNYVVTPDVSDAGGAVLGGTGRGMAGAFCAASSADNAYMWIQTRGLASGIQVGSGVAANSALEMSSSNLFEDIGSTLSGGTAITCGFAVGAATDTVGGGNSTADVQLYCL